MVKNPPLNARDTRDAGSIPGSGRSPGDENSNPPRYSCLGNPWTEEPGGLQLVGSQKSQMRLRDQTATSAAYFIYYSARHATGKQEVSAEYVSKQLLYSLFTDEAIRPREASH